MNQLPVYKGKRFYCDGCGGYFRPGDLIGVWRGHVFHYPIFSGQGDVNDCINIWTLRHKKQLRIMEIIGDIELDCQQFPDDGAYFNDGDIGAAIS